MNLTLQMDANSLKREPRVRNSDLDYIASNGKTTDGEWFGRDLEGSVSVLIEVLSRNLSGGDEELYYKISVRIDVILGEIRTEYLLHTSLELCRYIDLLGVGIKNLWWLYHLITWRLMKLTAITRL
jgi:hypothetical protein